jgi:uncharacterized protein (TIGR03083 family)
MNPENQHRSETPAPTEAELRAEVTAQRSELAAIVAALSPDDWDAATLCSGWRVRELVAHLTMPFRYSPARFMEQLARSGGNFTRMSDRCARRDAAAMSTGELTAALADNVAHPWKPPGGGVLGALSHDLIHGSDFTVPLGIDWAVPEARLRLVLGQFTSEGRNHFDVDLEGISLHADDMEWSYGSGVALHGAAKDLLLVVCGRTLPAGHLHGEAAARFSSTERDSA